MSGSGNNVYIIMGSSFIIVTRTKCDLLFSPNVINIIICSYHRMFF